jgi:hypothetical protein
VTTTPAAVLDRVLGIPHARGRRSLLRLGRERIELLEFTDSAGRPYPTLRGGVRAALISGPGGHRFLVAGRDQDFRM